MSGGDFDLMTPAEVAKCFKVSPGTISRNAKQKLIPAVRTPGGHFRFRRRVVEALLAGEDPWEADREGRHVPASG